ncbi:MAG: gliding motility lipoprotein GldH [Ichthyobacteriaceae bacterium]|nr:gliding motility lipoprotein GldH [Ichthyobacteriaceae bacterium]
MLRSLFVSIAFIFVFIACDSNGVYDNYVNIPDAEWHKDSIISFNFEVNDTVGKKEIFIKVRNNVDYEYSNLYLFSSIKFPDGKIMTDTLEYEMTNAEGVWLGYGIGSLKSNILYYKKNVVFYLPGSYKIKIQHGMRDGILVGIQDVGVRVADGNNSGSEKK